MSIPECSGEAVVSVRQPPGDRPSQRDRVLFYRHREILEEENGNHQERVHEMEVNASKYLILNQAFYCLF